jgi:hypothetical protein
MRSSCHTPSKRGRGVAAALSALAAAAAICVSGASGSVPGSTAAADDVLVTTEETSVAFNPLDNDSADLLPSSVSIVSDPLHGSVSANGQTGVMRYLPYPHFNGTDTFAYQACTAQATCVSAGVRVEVSMLGNYRLVFQRGLTEQGQGVIKTIDVSGGHEQSIPASGDLVGDWPTVSPLGDRVAAAIGVNIVIRNRDGTILAQKDAPGSPDHLSWAPGSDYTLVFSAEVSAGEGVYKLDLPQPNDPLGQPKITPILDPTADQPKYGRNPSFGPQGIVVDSYYDGTGDRQDGIYTTGGNAIYTDSVGEHSEQPDARADGAIVFVTRRSAATCGSFFLWTLRVLLAGASTPTDLYSRCTGADGQNPITAPRFSPDGTKIAFQDGLDVVRAINTDGTHLQTVIDGDPYLTGADGSPRPSWDTVSYPAPPSQPWTSGGHLLVVAAPANNGTCCLGDRAGTIRRLNGNGSGVTDFLAAGHGLFQAGTQADPAWSPDGSRLAFSALDIPGEGVPALRTLFVVNMDGSGLTQITNTGSQIVNWGQFKYPAWSPDGARLVAVVNPYDPTNGVDNLDHLWTMNPDGSNIQMISDCGGSICWRPTWSPDSALIAFNKGGPSIWVVHPDGSGEAPVQIPAPYVSDKDMSWSPSGAQVAFVSNNHLVVGDYISSPASVARVRIIGPASTFGASAEPVWSRDGRAIAFIREGSSVTTTGELWLVDPDGTSNTKIGAFDDVTLSQPQWGPGAAPPTVQAVSPQVGPTAGGTTVTVTGSGFGGPGTSVSFGGVDGTVSGGSSTSLTVVTPAHDAGQVNVVVGNPDGQSATLVGGFSFRDGPIIDRISPAFGPLAGGTAVTISGSGFGGPGTTVAFGDSAAVVSGGSSTSLTVTTPAHTAGVVDVAVRNPDGQIATLPNSFTYSSAPELVGVAPNAGPPSGGTAVTLSGNNFGGPGTTVEFGGATATVTGGNSTTLQVTTPPHAAGAVDVFVTNPDGQASLKANAFTYVTLFVTVTPSSGPAGTSIQLAGAGYRAGETINVTYATGMKRPSSIALCASQARSDGTWSCTAAIPTKSQGAAGAHTITATGKKSKKTATTSFNLS